MKILIVGAVAGGASAAARARRLDEQAEIILLERGPDPSFANCGLPYYVGGVIEDRNRLLVTPIERLRKRYRLDVRPRSEVISIDREQKMVVVNNLATQESYELTYDKLILSPGAAPLRPPIPGIDLPGIYTLRDLHDADQLEQATASAEHAVVVGAGFIGLEMVENLVHRGIKTTVVELSDQILPPWDAEMASSLAQHLRDQGVQLHLADAAQSFQLQTEANSDETNPEDCPSKSRKAMVVRLQSGLELKADLVLMSVGVRPENKLAVEAELEVGPRGGIRVNRFQQTSDPDIYAVGDAVEVEHFVDKSRVQIALGGPANRQGRLAADHLLGRNGLSGENTNCQATPGYRGTQGTSIVGLFGMAASMTGLSEKGLLQAKIPHEKIYVHAGHHASYYPGAHPLSIKLLFCPESGKILGAQVIGQQGVDKRIDVLAMAIQAGFTVYALEESELAYAPQFGSAKDPVNMAGFVASGVLRGDQPIVHAKTLHDSRKTETAENKPFVLDVRTAEEFAAGHIDQATNIPIDELRDRHHELPRKETIVAYCKVGMRGYLATRLLTQLGYRVANLSGGWTTYCHVVDADT